MDACEKLNYLQDVFNNIQECNTREFCDFISRTGDFLKKEECLEPFLQIVYRVLCCRKPCLPSKIVLFFKRLFENVATSQNGEVLLKTIFLHLLNLINSKYMRVRQHAIFFMNLIIESGNLKDILDLPVLEKLSEKLFDKEKAVRKEAVILLKRYQNVNLNQSTKILNLFKNLCRCDPSHDVRKTALESLEINDLTVGCIVEKCSDVSLGVRTCFYNHCISKIDFKQLEHEMRIFLLQKAYCERDVDGKSKLKDACLSFYNLPEDYYVLVKDFYHPRHSKILEVFLFDIFKEFEYEVNFESLSNNLDEISAFLYYVSLKYKDENFSRDDLNLPALAAFTELLYKSCQYMIESDNESIFKKKVVVMKSLFKILHFYDFFDEESCKIIHKAVFKLLNKNPIEDVIEESVIVINKIHTKKGVDVLGTLVYNHYKEGNTMCYTLSKYIMKHASQISDFENAIINEIVLQNIEAPNSVEILFFYLSKVFNTDLFDKFVENDHERHYEMLVDLAIIHDEDLILTQVSENLRISLSRGLISCIIPTTKIILAKLQVEEALVSRFFSFSLRTYYQTELEDIQQYLGIFFYEVFKEDSLFLIENFCNVFDTLEKNSKVFIDQSLYWISNSKRQKGTQLLFYNICVHIYLYHSVVNVKNYYYLLSKIDIVNGWDLSLTKKILFCLSQILKNAKNKLNVREYVASVMLVDDGEPISGEDLLDVKRDLHMN